MMNDAATPGLSTPVKTLATEALHLARRIEKTGGVSRAIRHPGLAPEWWREMMREAQADYWSESGPDHYRYLFACSTLADLANFPGDGGSAVERVSAPADGAALLAWLRSSTRRVGYVRTAHLLAPGTPTDAIPDDASPDALTPASRQQLTEGYLYEHREVSWIVEDCVREAAALDQDSPRLRVRDRNAELAQAARAARAALDAAKVRPGRG